MCYYWIRCGSFQISKVILFLRTSTRVELRHTSTCDNQFPAGNQWLKNELMHESTATASRSEKWLLWPMCSESSQSTTSSKVVFCT